MHARRSASGVAVLQNSIYVAGKQVIIQQHADHWHTYRWA